MEQIDDLKLIKKYYGQAMMHLCRELFPTILEQKGLLFKLIDKKFNHSKFLYDDIVKTCQIDSFKDLIYSEVDVENNCKVITHKTPKELMEEAGYSLFECKTEEDIQSFKKYYAPGEELCTFNGERLNRCHVFFAVSKNINNIKRENFKYPERQDEYGTSVISIQFSKGNINTLSIKNRYNHKVNNPDSTFSNNLDNIKQGLTESFNKYYNLNINSNCKTGFELKDYVLANDGKYYKVNYEVNNIYYCPDNILIDNFEVKKYDKEKYIIFDYFILDLVNKKLCCETEDSFVKSIGEIEKVEILNNKEKETKNIIINNGIIITLNKQNQIIKYKNKIVKEIGNNFLALNKTIKTIILPNVIRINDFFLIDNKTLELIHLPKVEYVGEYFLNNNSNLEYLSLPNLKGVERNFLARNNSLKLINLPKVEYVARNFLYGNKNSLKNISLPNVIYISSSFLNSNVVLESINLPKVKQIYDNFLYHNNNLLTISLPEVVEICPGFLHNNETLIYASFPKVKQIYDDIFLKKYVLTYLYCPNLDTTILKEYNSKTFLKIMPNDIELVREALAHSEKIPLLALKPKKNKNPKY